MLWSAGFGFFQKLEPNASIVRYLAIEKQEPYPAGVAQDGQRSICDKSPMAGTENVSAISICKSFEA